MSVRSPRVVPVAAAAAVLLALACGPGEMPPDSGPPRPAGEVRTVAAEPLRLPVPGVGGAAAGSLGADSRHVYSLVLAAGTYAHLAVEQRGLDVRATVTGPGGRWVVAADSPSGGRGREELFVVASVAGLYRLEIAAWPGGEPGGGYTLRLVERRRASPTDRVRATAARRLAAARAREAAGEPVAAARGYRAAIRLWRGLGETVYQARALYRLGRLEAARSGREAAAVRSLSRSLALWRQLGERRWQALVLGDLGRVQERSGELAAAARSHRGALGIWRRLGVLPEQAARANDLAGILARRGRVHRAIELYRTAAAAWRRAGARRRLAVTRTNLGILYASLGDYRLALDQYRAALELLDERAEARQRAVTLNKLGDALLWLEGPGAALPPYREALALRRRHGDERGVAVTLNSIALAQERADRPGPALAAYREAEAIFRRRDEAAELAVVRGNQGRAFERLGRAARAAESYREALEVARRAGHPQAEASALFGLARSARRQGRLAAAERRMRQALGVIEAVRGRSRRPDLSSSYLAARQDYYEFLVDLLAERARRQPRAGFETRALAVSERSRARSLLDDLDREGGAAAASESTALAERLNAAHLERLRRAEDDGRSRRLATLLERYRQRLAAGAEPPPARRTPWPGDRERVRELLGDDTVLLEYFVGEERSYLWAVGPAGSRFVADLPDRGELAALVRRLRRRLTRSRYQTGEVAARQSAVRAGEVLLGPVADLLAGQRLVIVAPGILQYVPFAALATPPATGARPVPLVTDHEVVAVPSLAVLAALRRRGEGRPRRPGAVAVVADPVVTPRDRRLAGIGPVAEGPGRGLRLDRLIHSRREAEAILSLVPPARSFAALGFAARRELVDDGSLAGYRIVHFATHGLVDPEQPELSSLVLSLYAPDGTPRDGFLRAYETSRLELPVELVVLSACDTVHGREVRGEGLVGLTHGFLRAGASRVMVSLWSVDDRATSELMRRFYSALLVDGDPPGRALRRAQLAMLADEDRRAPYYWAGFSLYGDWR